MSFREIIQRLKIYAIIIVAIFLILCIIALCRYWPEISAFLQSSFISFIDSIAIIVILILGIIWIFRSML